MKFRPGGSWAAKRIAFMLHFGPMQAARRSVVWALNTQRGCRHDFVLDYSQPPRFWVLSSFTVSKLDSTWNRSTRRRSGNWVCQWKWPVANQIYSLEFPSTLKPSSARPSNTTAYRPAIFCRCGWTSRIVRPAAKIRPISFANAYFPRFSIRAVHECESRERLIREVG